MENITVIDEAKHVHLLVNNIATDAGLLPSQIDLQLVNGELKAGGIVWVLRVNYEGKKLKDILLSEQLKEHLFTVQGKKKLH